MDTTGLQNQLHLFSASSQVKNIHSEEGKKIILKALEKAFGCGGLKKKYKQEI